MPAKTTSPTPEAQETHAAIAAPTPDPAEAEPLVDLDDVSAKRPTVRFEAKLYEIRRLGEFGIAKQRLLQRDGREFALLWDSDDELTQDQDQRLKMLLDRVFEEVLDAPVDVRQKMGDGDRARVVLGFRIAPLLTQRTAPPTATDETQARDGSTTAS